MPKKKKGQKLDWATFCEDYAETGPKRSFGRKAQSNALPSGPSGLPSGPGGGGGGGGGGDRYGARGSKEQGSRYGSKMEDENAGRSEGAGNWRRGGGGGTSSFGGGGGSSFGGGGSRGFGSSSRDDRDGGRDDDERPVGPSKADESNNWRSSKAAPARREITRRSDPPPRRDPPRERPQFGGDRPSFAERRAAAPAADRDPPRFGSAVRDRPPARAASPPRRRAASPPRRTFQNDRPPARDDIDFGSFRNREPGPRGPARPAGMMNRVEPTGNGFGRVNVKPTAEEFEVDAAGDWKAQQKRMERGGEFERPKDRLVEGTARIKAAPLNAWGSRGNPISGPSRPRGSAAPMGRPEPARAPPRQPVRQTRYSGTPTGFGYDLVQQLMQNGLPGRNRASPQRQSNSRFARPADDFPRRGDNRFQENGRRSMPREGDAPSSGAVNLSQKRAEAGRGPTSNRSGPPTSRSSPPASRQAKEEAFPTLPDAPKMVHAKVPPNTARIKKEEQAQIRRERERKRREEDEVQKKRAQENLVKSKDFVIALGESGTIPADIFKAGLSVINDHPDISIKSKYKHLCATLEFKTPTHDPDLPNKLVQELLSTSIGATLMDKALGAAQLFGILTQYCTDKDCIATVAEKAFKYILKRAKGDDSRLIALVEGVDVMALLGAPEDKDDWDDFLEEKELICLAPPEDVGEEIATAVEAGESPKELLDILADTEGNKIPPSICKQIATYLADRYVKSEKKADEFVDSTVCSLFRKIAKSEESQINAINSLTDRWYEGGKTRSSFILLVKALFDKEVVPASTLVEWKDRRGSKPKQAALLDSYDLELVGGTEVINMSDYIQKIDPANARNRPQEEESDSEDEDEVHNSYLGGDAINAHHGQDALPDDDYGEWSD